MSLQFSQELLEETVSISGLQPEESGRMLCIMNGAGAGLSGGALGYVFGFGENIYDAGFRIYIALEYHIHRAP